MSEDLVPTLARYDTFGAEHCVDGVGPAARRDRLAASGLNNWWVPTDLGGPGIDLAAGVGIAEVLATHDPGLAFAACVSGLGGTIIDLYGGPECRERVLGDLVRTGGFLATAGSEHDTGSELARTATRISDPGGGDLVVDGTKAFSTNAAHARHLVVLGRDGESRRRFRVVVLETDQVGVRVRREWPTFGLGSASTVELELDGARAALHCDGPGIRLLEVGLNVSRTLMAAIAVGICVRLQRELMAYAACKQVAGAPLQEHPVFAARLADLEMATQTMRWTVRAAAAAFDAAATDPARLLGRGVLPEAVIAKSTCGRTGWEQVAGLSTAMGGIGYLEDAPTTRALRDMRHVAIIEGGDDVVRELVYRRVVQPRAGRARSVAEAGQHV